jgi:hypothetical protein
VPRGRTVSRLRSEPVSPGPHPEPPPDLASRALPISVVAHDWLRLHSRNRDVLYFGATGHGRFDDPHRRYGVLYAAEAAEGCFVETLARDLRHNSITWSDLQRRLLTRIQARRPLRLVDLRGPGLRQLGADGRLSTGDYGVAQRWSLALHEHPAQLDGILYGSRFDPRQDCLALFERASTAVMAGGSTDLVDAANAHLLSSLLDAYQMELIDDREGLGEP